jgi:hypothetical protein
MVSENIDCPNCGKSNKGSFKYCMACGLELPQLKPESGNEVAPKPIAKTLDKTKIYTAIGSVLIFFVVFYSVQYFFYPSFDKQLMKIASELNKTCPVMVDNQTRLDNAITIPKNIFQYNYTLVNMEKSSVDTEVVKKSAEPLMINMVKTNPQMEFARAHKTTLNYLYRDKNGEYLFLISITPEMYE